MGGGGGWQRQVILLVVAGCLALYQVNKMDLQLEKNEELADRQLARASDRIAAEVGSRVRAREIGAMSFTLLEGQIWRPRAAGSAGHNRRYAGRAGDATAERIVTLIGSPHSLAETDLPGQKVVLDSELKAGFTSPKVFAELFIDPIERRKNMNKRKRSPQTKQKGSTSKRRKGHPSATQEDPLLAIRIYEPSLLPLSQELQRTGLVARIIRLGNAVEAVDKDASADKESAFRQQPGSNPSKESTADSSDDTFRSETSGKDGSGFEKEEACQADE